MPLLPSSEPSLREVLLAVLVLVLVMAAVSGAGVLILTGGDGTVVGQPINGSGNGTNGTNATSTTSASANTSENGSGNANEQATESVANGPDLEPIDGSGSDGSDDETSSEETATTNDSTATTTAESNDRSPDITVRSASDLIQAAENAPAGANVYVPPDVTITLEPRQVVFEQSDITLYSDGGQFGEGGATIRMPDEVPADQSVYSMIELRGDGSTVSGLRIIGPHPDLIAAETGSAYEFGISFGLWIKGDDSTVYNAEVAGWSGAGVKFQEADDGHIYRSNIHHNTDAGTGYGVSSERSWVLIQYNRFDANRHSIQTTRDTESGYRAEGNVQGPRRPNHAFDAHSASKTEAAHGGRRIEIVNNTFLPPSSETDAEGEPMDDPPIELDGRLGPTEGALIANNAFVGIERDRSIIQNQENGESSDEFANAGDPSEFNNIEVRGNSYADSRSAVPENIGAPDSLPAPGQIRGPDGTVGGDGSDGTAGDDGSDGDGIFGGANPIDEIIDRVKQFGQDIIDGAISAVIESIDQLKNTAIRGITITPSADDPGNFYQDPTNLAYPQVRQLWTQLGKPIAFLAWLLSALGLLAFGRFGAQQIAWAIEKKLWMGLFATAFLVTEMGWVVANVIPNLVDILVQSLLLDFTEQSVSDLGISALIVVVALVGLYFEAFLLLGLAVLAAVRIEVIMFMTPIIPLLLIVGWGAPSKIARTIAKSGIILWAVLLVSGVPSAFFLSAAMTASQSGLVDGLGLGAAAALVFQISGFLIALLSPIVVYKTMLPLLATIGPVGVTETSQKVSEKNQQYRNKLQRDKERAATTKQTGVDASRGLRDKTPRDDQGQFAEQSRAYRASNTVRQAPGAAKDRLDEMRERARRN